MPSHRRWWDPRHPVDVVTAMWSAADLLPVRTGTGAAYHAAFLTLRRVILGRTLTMEAAGVPVRMTVVDVVSLLDPRQLVQGRLDIRLSISDIRWGEYDFDHADVVLRNVALRPGAPPLVRAAPVEVTVDVPGATVDGVIRAGRPGLSGRIDADGVARLHWSRRPGWGNVEVDVDLEDDSSVAVLRVTPRALTVAGRRVRVPVGTQCYRLALHRLPPDVRITSVQCLPGRLRVRAELPRWRTPR